MPTSARKFEAGARVYTTTVRNVTIGQQRHHVGVVYLPKGTVGKVVGSHDSYRCKVMFLLSVGINIMETAPDGKGVELGGTATITVVDLIPEEYLIEIK